MSGNRILYYLYLGRLVRVYLDEDGDPDTADIYIEETDSFDPNPTLAIDSQMGGSGFTRIDETTYNDKLSELRNAHAADKG